METNFFVELFKIVIIFCAIAWIALTAYAAFEIDRAPDGKEDGDSFRKL
jgi:hypothetical protein